MQVHRFSVSVNCYLPDETAVTDTVQGFEECYDDKGFLILPDEYSEEGKPTRLVIICHGAGGAVGGIDLSRPVTGRAFVWKSPIFRRI